MLLSTSTPRKPASRNQLRSLEKSRLHTFYRHQMIALKPGYLWQLEEGYFRTIALNESGDVKTLGIWGAGDIVGIPIHRNYPFQIESLSTAKAFLIHDKSIFGGQWLVSYLKQTESLLMIQYQNLVRDRLILLLEWLEERFGHQSDRGRTIAIRLTHQEISEAINSTRVTVTRVLKELEEEGFLEWSKRQCVLLGNCQRDCTVL